MTFLRLIQNFYFYIVLGGFFVITGIFNLYSGEYVPGTIGYIYVVPAILLILLSVFGTGFAKVVIDREKCIKCLLPVMLFFLWMPIDSLIRNTINDDQTLELLKYMFFYSVIPFVCGLLISRYLDKINFRWGVATFLLLLTFGLISAGANWQMLLYGTYKVTGYADISYNTYGILLGCYAVAFTHHIYHLRVPAFGRFICIMFLALTSSLLIFFSGSMGCLLSVYFASVLFFILSRRYSRSDMFRIKGIFFVLVITVLSFMVVYIFYVFSMEKTLVPSFGSDNFAKYFYRIDAASKGHFSEVETGRTYYISMFLEQFFQNPIFGKGFGSRTGLRCDPHDYIIELLGETGLMSLIVYLSIIYYPLRFSIRVLKHPSEYRNVYLFIAIAMVVVFFESFFSGSVFVDPQMWFLIGVIPISSNIHGEERV